MPACPDKVTIRTLDNPCDLKTRKTWEDEPWRPVLEYAPREFRKDPNLRIIHNGMIIHRDEWHLIRPIAGDEVIFSRAPGDLGTLITIGASLLLMGVSYGVQTALAPSVKPLGRELKESPTYGWDAIYSTVRPGTPIPLIYGQHRVGGHIIQQFQQQTGAGDSKTSEMHTLLALCAGPIEGVSGVLVNGNPIADYGSDVLTETHLGYNHQPPMAGFAKTKNATSIDRDLEYGDDKAEIITTTNEVDSFEVAIRFPAGLYRVNDRGNYKQHSVQLKFDWEYADNPTTVWTSTETISRKTQNPFEFWFYSPQNLPARAKYKITITRQTPDDSDPAQQSQTQILALNEVLDEPLTYPNIALLGLRHLPSSKLSGQTPTYSALVSGRRVKVYSTLTVYTVQWSDNPAWCLRDYMLDPRWGLGAWITESKIVQQDFLDFATWCDTMVAKDAEGELEKQFRLNMVIDGSLSAIDCMRQMVSTGRAWLVKRGDKWGIKIDKAESHVQMFSMGRVIKGSFSTSKISKVDLANVFSGEFYNEALDFETDNLPKEDQTLDAEANPIDKTISLLGTTTSTQANRLLNYYMLGNRLVRRQIEFAVGAEAIAMEAGDVFKFSHDVPGWGWSGKIRSIDETGTTLTLDRTLTFEAGVKYEITVIHPGTDVVDTMEVTNPPGTTNIVTVAGDWSQAPVEASDYSVGPVTQSVVLYRAMSVSVGPKPWQRRIRAREYNPAIYDQDLTVLVPPSVTRLTDPNRIPADVRDLRLQERQVFSEDGTLSCAIDVHFTLPAVEGVHAEVYWREADTDSWTSAGPPVSIGYLSITENVESPGGSYEVSVVSVSASGNRKSPEHGVQATITTVGTTRQPQNVAGFNASRTLGGLIFSWLPVDPTINFDLAYYEIRNGAVWDSALLVGKTTDTSLETSVIVSGNQTFLIRAFNTAGKSSPLATVLIIEVEGRIGENVILTRTEEAAWTGARENFTLDAGKLVLNTQADMVAWRGQQHVAPFASGFTPGGYGLGFRVSGSYTSEAFQVATDALRCLIATEMELNQVDTSLYWDAPDLAGIVWDSEFAKTRMWSVAPEGRVIVKLEMRFSTTTSDDSAFGLWQERPQNIETLVKWAQVRVSVTIKDPAFTCELSMLKIHFDVPDVSESGSVDTVATGTVAVVYGKEFNAIPKVTCTIVGATAGDDVIMSVPAKTGFSIEVKNGGSRVVRSVHWHAIGY